MIFRKRFQRWRVGHTAAACRSRAKGTEQRRESLQLEVEGETDIRGGFFVAPNDSCLASKSPPRVIAVRTSRVEAEISISDKAQDSGEQYSAAANADRMTQRHDVTNDVVKDHNTSPFNTRIDKEMTKKRLMLLFLYITM